MKLDDLFPTLMTVRSMGFGTSLGIGCGLALQIAGLIDAGVDPQRVALTGGLIGMGLHQMVDVIIVRAVLRPIGNCVRFYGRLVEAVLLGSVLPFHERGEAVRNMIRVRIHVAGVDGRQAVRSGRDRRSNRAGGRRAGDPLVNR